MKLNIRGSKLEITEAIKEYAVEKIGKLDKYFKKPEEIVVNLNCKVRKQDQVVEVTVHTHNYVLRAEEAQDDMYAAIDLVVDKLERQIRKNKTRFLSRRDEEVFSFNFDEEKHGDDHKVVKRKEIELKPMSEEEAILMMDLIGHDFYVYKDRDTMSINVVYKRKESHYGIIETK